MRKIEIFKIGLLWSGRKGLQKPGDNQDVMKVLTRLPQVSHVMSYPQGTDFFSLISGVLGT